MHINDACGVRGHMGKVVPLITPKKKRKRRRKEGEKKDGCGMYLVCVCDSPLLQAVSVYQFLRSTFFFKKTCVMRACGEVSNITKCVRGDP